MLCSNSMLNKTTKRHQDNETALRTAVRSNSSGSINRSRQERARKHEHRVDNGLVTYFFAFVLAFERLPLRSKMPRPPPRPSFDPSAAESARKGDTFFSAAFWAASQGLGGVIIPAAAPALSWPGISLRNGLRPVPRTFSFFTMPVANRAGLTPPFFAASMTVSERMAAVTAVRVGTTGAKAA